MGISTDQLLVLKAFYLGYEIREKHELEERALKMIDYAINQLSNKTNKSDLKRLLFYLIVKCELLRFNETVASYRRKAREVAQDINKDTIYKDYMAMVDQTTLIPKTRDITQQSSYTGLTSLKNSPTAIEDYMEGFFEEEIPFTAIGVRSKELSTKGVIFLKDKSLVDIMKSHKINYKRDD